jgi:hypothetical protein
MANIQESETLVGREVERLFGEISAKRGDLCTNPITGEQFIYDRFSIEHEKQAAYRRLLVREYFALNGPSDAPLMPIDEWDRDRAKHLSGLLGFITAQFMWSMESQDDLRVHPSFADFAAGMLWLHEDVGGPSELLPGTPEQLSEMTGRYPPRKLEGLNCFSWLPPKRQNRSKQRRRAA